MGVNPIPTEHQAVSPYLAVKGGLAALEFYKTAFGATEDFQMIMPDGKLGHAEIRIGDSVIMMADEFPEFGFRAPEPGSGAPVCLHLYVENVDEVFARAVAAGAKELKPVVNQFYGDRSGQLEDPFGHVWWVATRVEEMTVEEMQRRLNEMYGGEQK